MKPFIEPLKMKTPYQITKVLNLSTWTCFLRWWPLLLT